MNEHKRVILFSLSIVFGLSLIVGATWNLPIKARGLVTGRSGILIDRLAARIGTDALTQMVLEAGLVDSESRLVARISRENRERENGRRDERRRGARERQLDDALADQLEWIGPDLVCQVAVDAGLLTQTEANEILSE